MLLTCTISHAFNIQLVPKFSPPLVELCIAGKRNEARLNHLNHTISRTLYLSDFLLLTPAVLGLGNDGDVHSRRTRSFSILHGSPLRSRVRISKHRPTATISTSRNSNNQHQAQQQQSAPTAMKSFHFLLRISTQTA